MGDQQKAQVLDPLRRVFVFTGRRFTTADGIRYERSSEGSTIRRQIPKVRGKAARRADKAARRK